MIYVGIDPGQSGGIAWIAPCDVHAEKMPETEADVLQLLRDVTIASETVVVIEKVGSMPGQGVHSVFVFGQHYGMLRGFLTALRVPFLEVAPLKWQNALGVARPRGTGPKRADLSQAELGERKREHKNDTKAKAQQLYPQVKKITHATADALLLATYCSRLDWRGVVSRALETTAAAGMRAVDVLADQAIEDENRKAAQSRLRPPLALDGRVRGLCFDEK